jgi:hypothetical protein
MTDRRRFLATALVVPGAANISQPARAADAQHMPGDPPQHRLVYQLNQAEPDYIEHILNSIGALIGKYEDNVAIAVVAFGPGIHLLAKAPGRPVPLALRQRAASQAHNYGVRFIACGNTIKSLGWSVTDIVDFARVEEVGAATLMEMQEQGWAYIAW